MHQLVPFDFKTFSGSRRVALRVGGAAAITASAGRANAIATTGGRVGAARAGSGVARRSATSRS